jgi:hypothetical protein
MAGGVAKSGGGSSRRRQSRSKKLRFKKRTSPIPTKGGGTLRTAAPALAAGRQAHSRASRCDDREPRTRAGPVPWTPSSTCRKFRRSEKPRRQGSVAAAGAGFGIRQIQVRGSASHALSATGRSVKPDHCDIFATRGLGKGAAGGQRGTGQWWRNRIMIFGPKPSRHDQLTNAVLSRVGGVEVLLRRGALISTK